MALFSVYPVNTYSAAVDLSFAPLFSSTAVDPNIFFVLDDSATMQTDQMSSDLSVGGVYSIAGVPAPFLYPVATGYHTFPNVLALPSQEVVDAYNADDLTYPIDLHSDASGVWRARNSDYNKIYYNPEVYYQPWKGVNSAGTAYGFITDPKFAPWDPYESAGATLDLTVDLPSFNVTVKNAADVPADTTVAVAGYYVPRYYTYVDTNDNGVIDANDEHTLHEIVSGSGVVYTRGAGRTDCISAGLCTAAEELQNFATWWSYHRSRDKVMKALVASVVSDSANVRMGMATSHNNSQRDEIADMDIAANKTGLLSTLFQYRGTLFGSPLTAALERAGNYYACGNAAKTVNDNRWSYGPDGGPGINIGSGNNLFDNTNCPINTVADGGACQQNFTVLLTDGLNTATNTSFPYYKNSLDGDPFVGWGSATVTTTRLANRPFVDGGTSNSDANTSSKFDGGAYADDVSDTLADVAMHFYKTDLSPLANKVPTQTGVDENDQQHMVTYVVGLLNTDELSIIPALPTDPTASFAGWHDDTYSTEVDNIMDLLHAAYNGRGGAYGGRDAAEMSAEIQSVVGSIADRVGSASAVAFNTTTLSTKTEVYLALFNSSRWSGDLVSYTLDSNTGKIGVSSNWRAGDRLTSRTAARNIFTYTPKLYTGKTTNGLDFTYANLAKMSNKQTDDLAFTTSADVFGLSLDEIATLKANLTQERIKFLRGDRSKEGTLFRVRDSRLGDIVHSGPVFVGTPNLNWGSTAPFPVDDSTTTPATESYATWREQMQDATSAPLPRKDAVYLGSNDGMLHAFDASSGADGGKELFAYIPHALFSNATAKGLHYLGDPAYNHEYYVDVTPTIADVFNADPSNPFVATNEWYTILVGALRGGARGIYTLNVTHPGSFNASNVMLEFDNDPDWVATTSPTPPMPHTGDKDLGYTFSRPKIVMTNAVRNGQHRWAAIIGNGYNNTGSGLASLLVIFLDPNLTSTTTPQTLGWTEGLDYRKISVPVGYGDPSTPNGLSTPTAIDVSVDTPGTADRVYAGDLLGNMWAFDISNSDPALWAIRHNDGTDDIPLFAAISGQARPITSAPAVALKAKTEVSSGASTGRGGGRTTPAVTETNITEVVVLYGTGQYMANGDNDPATQYHAQRFFGIYDIDGSEDTPPVLADLVPQVIDPTLLSITDPSGVTTAYRSITANATTVTKGWYIELPTTGERVVTNPVVRENNIFFNTTIPSDQLCTAGGVGWLLAVDYLTGLNPTAAVLDTNDDGVVNTADNAAAIGLAFKEGLPSSSTFLGNRRYTPGTETSSGADVQSDVVEELNSPDTNRLSWEELYR